MEMGPRVHLFSVFSMMQWAVFQVLGGVGLGAGGGGEWSGSIATPGSSADNGERRGKVWAGKWWWLWHMSAGAGL